MVFVVVVVVVSVVDIVLVRRTITCSGHVILSHTSKTQVHFVKLVTMAVFTKGF